MMKLHDESYSSENEAFMHIVVELSLIISTVWQSLVLIGKHYTDIDF